MSNSGLKRVFYLIEGSKVSFGASRGAAITTAFAMTQVHHHHCQHIDETVSFFAQIHAQLQQLMLQVIKINIYKYAF